MGLRKASAEPSSIGVLLAREGAGELVPRTGIYSPSSRKQSIIFLSHNLSIRNINSNSFSCRLTSIIFHTRSGTNCYTYSTNPALRSSSLSLLACLPAEAFYGLILCLPTCRSLQHHHSFLKVYTSVPEAYCSIPAT